MLSIAIIKNHAGDGGGLPSYLKQSEYYLDKNGVEQSSAAWWGKGAAALGLIGKPVTEDLMDKLADGFSPTDEKLRQNAGRKPEYRPTLDRDGKQRMDENGKPMGAWIAERVGYDLTFSAPKSFSIAFAAADPELRDRMLACHHKAVETGLHIMERHAGETRRGKGSKDVIEVEGLLVSRHTHYAARSHDQVDGVQGTGIDMQVHTHALVYNSVIAENSWSSLDASEMFQWKKAVGAAYRAELADGLKIMGFGIENDFRMDENGQIKDRFFKIAGVPDELIKERSGRRKQIEIFMEDHPDATAQQATMATRAGKDEPTFGELVNSIWKDELADWRTKNPDQFPENIRDLLNRKLTPEQKIEAKFEAKRSQQDRDKEILDELHETKSVWSRKDLTQAIGERSAGKLDAKGIIAEVSSFLGRNDLALIMPEEIHADDKGQRLARRHRAVRFADTKVVEQEQGLVRDALARKDEMAIRLDPEIVKIEVSKMEKKRGFSLATEQLNSVDFVCTQTGGVAVVRGRAGTGKTVSAEVIVNSYLASGFDVIGAATGWDAAKKLEAEGGITSHSIASLNAKLGNGTLKLTSKTLLLIDEGGMVGTPSLAALMAHANKAGSKILIQGDALQIQSVERGSPIRNLIKAVGSVDLTDIRRQTGADRDTANAFYAVGDDKLRSRGQNQLAGEAILSRLEKRGQLQGFDSVEKAKKYLVDDYIQSSTPAREKLIIAGTRADVNQLNSMVRRAHQARGELGSDVTVDVRHPRTDVKSTLTVAVGERIRFGKKNDDLGIVNGTKAVVTGLTPQKDGRMKIEATIESDIKGENSRKITFSTDQYPYLEQAWAGTVHKSQGQGKDEVYQLFSKGMTDRQLSLVGFTRMKKSFALYGGPEIFDRGIDASVMTDRLQTNALTEGLHGKTTQQVIREKAREKSAAVEKLTREVPSQAMTTELRVKDPAVIQAGTAFAPARARMQAIAKEREQQASRMASRERKKEREQEQDQGGHTI